MGTPTDFYSQLRVDATRPGAIDTLVKSYRKHRERWGHTDAIEMAAADLGVTMRTLYRWQDRWPELLAAVEGARKELES
jgi:hypothetical protein